MSDHGARGHKLWSASASARHWLCPGSLALTKDVKDKESEAAAWGTACHQISERCLRNDQDAIEYIGRFEKTKEFTFEVDEEMADCAQVYIDYMRSGEGFTALYEQQFSLDAMAPPFDSGGTADGLKWFPNERMLEIVDLKGGRGVVVDAANNVQLRTYALGAVLTFANWPIRTVKVTIVQPRAPHKDGRIRSEVFHLTDLADWSSELLEAMYRAKKALDEKGQVPDATWNSAHLKAGDHCKFCKAAPCPAQDARVSETVGLWLDSLDQPHIANAPDAMSPEALSQALDIADMIEGWLAAVRARAHSQAESGTAIPNYILVEKSGREKWTEDGESKVQMLIVGGSIASKDVFAPAKLRTPKQVRDALKKLKKLDLFKPEWSSTPRNGTTLVRADKTSKQPVQSQIERFLGEKVYG